MTGVPQGPVFDHLQGSDASPQCSTGGGFPRSREEPRLSVDSSSSRDDLAKMPSGAPISAAFLSSLLAASTSGAAGAAAAVTNFRVDPPSVIEGRHSTTFRLLLNPPSRARCSKAGSRAEGILSSTENTTSSSTTRGADAGADAGGAGAGAAIPSSVFVKRIVCKELPARSLSKWR